MPIRTKGSGPPLFCVHGQPLKVAQRLNANRPIYGLSHVYHSSFLDETPESIEQLAGQYLSEVRQVQPHGPYHFCGFSAGGLPVGLQLEAAWWQEPLLLRVGHCFQQVTDWHLRDSPLGAG